MIRHCAESSTKQICFK